MKTDIGSVLLGLLSFCAAHCGGCNNTYGWATHSDLNAGRQFASMAWLVGNLHGLGARSGGAECGVTFDDEHIAAVVLDLCAKRGPEKSICPSEAARAVAGEGDWRELMVDVRRVAASLAKSGVLVATQRGKVVDARTARGPIRLRVNSTRLGD